MEAFGKFMAWILLLIASTILRGVAISYSWSWIIVKLFEMKELNIFQAIALSCFITLMHGAKKTTKEEEEIAKTSPYSGFWYSIMFSLLGLLLCYLSSLFI